MVYNYIIPSGVLYCPKSKILKINKENMFAINEADFKVNIKPQLSVNVFITTLSILSLRANFILLAILLLKNI